MRSYALRSLVVSASLLAACLGSDPAPTGTTPDPTPDGGDAAGSFALLDLPAQVVLAPGESVDLPISIQREGFTGTVDVSIDPLPKGVGATPLVLTAGKSTDVVKLTAASDAAQSLGTVQVIARAQPSLVQQKQMTVIVRGRAGERDITFGDQGGNVVVGGIVPRTMARMNDDGIAVLGEGATFYGVGRVLANGKIDTAFGTNGMAMLTNASGLYRQLVVQKDGKLLVAGRTDDFAKLVIHRLLPNGTYDASFGNAGIAEVALANGFFGIALDAAERIVVGSYPATFRRLTTDGKPDATFDGTLSTESDNWSTLLVRGETPIAVGYSTPDANGSTVSVSVVTSSTSKVERLFVSWNTVNVSSATLDQQGRILVVGDGMKAPATGAEAYVFRAKPNGEIDDTFGFGSPVAERFGLDTEHSLLQTVLEEPSGKVLCVGSNRLDDKKEGILVRYDANGKRDLAFGEQGLVKETNALIGEHGGAALQTSLATVVVARRYDPDSTVLLRYWR